MIKTILLLIIILNNQCYGQKLQVTLEKHSVIYKRIENVITLNTDSNNDKLKVTCTNCKTFKRIDSTNNYIIIPSKKSYTTIYVSDETDSIVLIQKIKNELLHNPDLFFGPKNNGDLIKISTALKSTLSAKYMSPFKYLNNSITIKKWKIIIGKKTYEGVGEKLTEEVLSKLKSLKKTKFIAVYATVVGPDGLARRIGAVYNIT